MILFSLPWFVFCHCLGIFSSILNSIELIWRESSKRCMDCEAHINDNESGTRGIGRCKILGRRGTSTFLPKGWPLENLCAEKWQKKKKMVPYQNSNHSYPTQACKHHTSCDFFVCRLWSFCVQAASTEQLESAIQQFMMFAVQK